MSVATPCYEYQQSLATWEGLRHAYEGGAAVQRMGERYLPRPSGMTGANGTRLYGQYRRRPRWFGATEHAVHGIGGAIMRKEPVLHAPSAMEAHLEDVTQTGVPWRTFAEQAVRETLLMGRFGVLVDFPEPLVTSDGLFVPDAEARPYWIAYQAEEIINWRTERRQGDTIVTLVVLKETASTPRGFWGTDDFFLVDERPQYRVLRLDEQGRYEVSVWADAQPQPLVPARQFVLRDRFLPTRQGVPLDFIPFVFMAPFSLEPHVEKSLLEALVEINYRYYLHSADYEHALHLIALPTLYICTNADLPPDILFGSATALHIPDSTAKVGLAALDAAGLPAHQIALKTDKEEMAVLGARLLQGAPSVQETATANLNRLSGADSPVQSLVTTVSQGLSQVLQLHAWWGGFTENVDDTAITMALNTDLVAQRMEPQMLLALMQALLNDTISKETFYHQLQQGEVARPGISFEDEQDAIAIQKDERPLVAPVPAPFAPRGAPQNGVTRPVA